MEEKEFEVQPEPVGAESLGIGPLIAYGPVIAQLIKALTQSAKVSFIVRALGRKKRVTVEDAG